MHNNLFKSWLKNRDNNKTILGTWLMAAAPATAEALGNCGFDFLVVDMEHVPIEFSHLTHLLRAIECGSAQAVVRLAWNDPILIKRALDSGARTLMLPFIENEEQAKAAARAMRYPPDGSRGVAAIHRGSRYGTIANYLQSANDFVSTIVQLETPQAIENLGKIAAVDTIDALFVGPGDLSAAMGHIGNIAHEQVQKLIEKAARDAHAAGKAIGIVGPNPEMVKRFIDYGYDFVAVASDLALMTGRAQEWLAKLRPDAPASSPSTAAY